MGRTSSYLTEENAELNVVSRHDSYLKTGGCLITRFSKLWCLCCVLPPAFPPHESTSEECENCGHLSRISQCPLDRIAIFKILNKLLLQVTSTAGLVFKWWTRLLSLERSLWVVALCQGIQECRTLLTQWVTNLARWGGRKGRSCLHTLLSCWSDMILVISFPPPPQKHVGAT